jgi:hypothetical protein
MPIARPAAKTPATSTRSALSQEEQEMNFEQPVFGVKGQRFAIDGNAPASIRHSIAQAFSAVGGINVTSQYQWDQPAGYASYNDSSANMGGIVMNGVAGGLIWRNGVAVGMAPAGSSSSSGYASAGSHHRQVRPPRYIVTVDAQPISSGRYDAPTIGIHNVGRVGFGTSEARDGYEIAVTIASQNGDEALPCYSFAVSRQSGSDFYVAAETRSAAVGYANGKARTPMYGDLTYRKMREILNHARESN